MPLLRDALLRAARSGWLRERAVRCSFVRRSVSRFMPGETLDDALSAARALHQRGVPAIFTRLGENVGDCGEADAVTRHYLEVLDRVADGGLDAQISVKLTQLGLDQDPEHCFVNLERLVRHAEQRRNFVWIDMESSEYVERTLEQYRRARAASPRVGVCLQAYLRRTAADVEALLPLRPAIRLVKGAYREPPQLAFPRKRDVDEAFFALSARLLRAAGGGEAGLLALGTHDARLIRRALELAAAESLPAGAWEVEMLYGIRRGLQERLAAEGVRLRVLIAYGEYWFPWYMRRLAERPANVLFVLRSLLPAR
jgi:proline dehydrogenase